MVVPRYDAGGFASLPRTVARHLDAGARVLLILLDGFGWPFFTRHGDHRLLRRLDVTPLTTQFPSTTTAHITTLHTGVPVGEHGLYEWNVYEPTLDALVTPLMFSFTGDSKRDTLLRAGASPQALFDQPTLYERLPAECHVFASAEFSPSTFDGVLTRGATIHPIRDLRAGIAEAGATLRATSGAAYAYLHWPEPDATGHVHGPSSTAFAQMCERCLGAVEAGLVALPPDTVVLLTADHGQVDVDPVTTVFLDEAWPAVTDLLARGADGRPLAPAGSARDLFLHCRPEAIDDVVAGARRVLRERATVHRTADLVADGTFGPAGPRLQARLADVCILPGPGETVWWRGGGRFTMRFRGHHGGLAEDEALTQVGALVV